MITTKTTETIEVYEDDKLIERTTRVIEETNDGAPTWSVVSSNAQGITTNFSPNPYPLEIPSVPSVQINQGDTWKPHSPEKIPKGECGCHGCNPGPKGEQGLIGDEELTKITRDCVQSDIITTIELMRKIIENNTASDIKGHPGGRGLRSDCRLTEEECHGKSKEELREIIQKQIDEYDGT